MRVSSDKLLWIQVRSTDQQTAEQVLESVDTRGSLG
jgi:hypothetical protein